MMVMTMMMMMVMMTMITMTTYIKELHYIANVVVICIVPTGEVDVVPIILFIPSTVWVIWHTSLNHIMYLYVWVIWYICLGHRTYVWDLGHMTYICLGQSFKIVLNTNFNSLFYAWVHGDMFDTLNSAGKVLLSFSPSLLFSFRSFISITILIISINTSSQFLSTRFCKT